MTDSINVRMLALDCLMEINEQEQYSHLVLRDVLGKYQYLMKQQRAFLTRLVEGTLERQITLDFCIDAFSKVKVHKMKPFIRNLLRMSVYQLRYMDAIPDSAVCNEAVKLAKKRGFASLSGFVNGVLRSIARGEDPLQKLDRDKNPVQYLSVMFSVPEWMVTQWIENYGQEKARQILEGICTERAVTIRTNLLKCTPKELKERLEEEGVRVDEVPGLSYAFSISGFDYLDALGSFADGWFYVQDVSSMMVVETALGEDGDMSGKQRDGRKLRVLDVCAAPGGKSTHMAERIGDMGQVEARDLTEYKVGLINDNIRRHALSNMQAVVWDATILDKEWLENADILLCDLPCSGLGVMGRKPDIRYKMTKEKQEDLVTLQRKILETVQAYVRPGGILVYSTCTVHREENEGNVAWLLEQYPEFSLITQRQIFPQDAGQDGFFIAKLVRK